MRHRSTVAVTAFLLALSAVAAMPVAGLTTQTSTQAAANGSNGTFGSAISSFMQASTAETEGDVDNGMWAVGFDRADEQAQAAMVDRRTDALERRLERLERQRAELLNDSADNVSMADRARAARLTARAEALRNAINQTESAGVAIGVDVSRLQQLREEARNLTGPEVAGLARNITDTPGVGPSGDGPPANGPDNGDENQTQADQSGGSNESDSGGSNAEGPPDDAPANDR